ncbi:uncharacterized protein ISCGN_021150 [Ixodes scapularis]
MKYAISLIVVVFSAVFNPASASDPSCINVSLSNVLGLGDCLGTSGDLCTGNQDGALNYIGKLAECVLEGTENLDLGTQGYIILQLLEATLQRNGLEVLLSPIKLVCDYINVDCSVLNLNTNAVCGDPIVVNLPSALNIGQTFEQELRKMAPRAETDKECRLLSPSALVVCFCTDAELTPELVQDFEELDLNSFRTGVNRTRQCSGRATSG